MQGLTINEDGSFTIAPRTPFHNFIRECTENYILGPTSRSVGDGTIAMQDWRPDEGWGGPSALRLTEKKKNKGSEFVLTEELRSPLGGSHRQTPHAQLVIGGFHDLIWLTNTGLRRLSGVDAQNHIWVGGLCEFDL